MTLTDFSYYVRRFYPFVIVGIIIFLIIFYLVKLSFLYLETIKPYTPYTNPAFGKIKRPYLAIASSSAGLRFTLDTIEGQPVTATDTAKVFFLPPPHAQFGYIEKIYLIAQNFGFNTELAKHKLVVDQAIFSEKNQKLIIDVRNFNFNYRYFFEVKPDLFDSVATPQSQDSENKAIDFLKSIGGYPDEFAQGKTNIIFLQYNPKGKTIAVLKNNLNANLVEVDFYRPDIENLPIVTPKYFNSQNYVLMAFTGSGEVRILRSEVKFFEKSEEQVGIYPLKTGEQAYEVLRRGEAYVVSNPENRTSITVKRMFLAYFDPDVYQDYLQPVYVFLGEGNFVAYVPAVSSEFLTE